MEAGHRLIINNVYTWFNVGIEGGTHLKAEVAFLVDPLSGVMIAMVTPGGFFSSTSTP